MGSDVDVVVVGAGFAGLYMLKKLRDQGASVRVFEAGSGVGGTWYWNRYPGARCDIESVEYSYGFDEELQQEWEWSERFATQPEILRYLEHVADRFDLRSGITFDTRVESATWDEATSTWSVTTSTGETVVARHVVMATGCLSSANLPTFDGLDAFEGAVYHTGQWPHEGVDFTGKRVAVIGTGSSGIQSIPVIAQQAEQLVVLQRTAAYSVPARNRAYDPSEVERVRSIYPDLRARQRLSAAGFGGIEDAEVEMVMASELPDSDRTARLEQRWEEGGLTFLGAFADAIISPESNEVVAEFVRDKIRGIVHDPSVAEMLAPRQVIGCKRLCVDTGYYETFNRENVRLVDISSTGIERITPTGVVANGEEHEVDVIVCATGFDAMTGALLKVDITGRNGVSLRDAWAEGPKTYLGLQTPGFPNLFMVTGPGSPSVLTNMVVSIEHHVEWISRCIADLDAAGQQTIEALPESAEQWVAYVNSVADLTLFSSCSSWYLGANIPGKPRVFMPLPGFGPYAMQCDQIAAAGYTGFTLA